MINDEIFANYLPSVTKIYNGISKKYEKSTNTPLSIRQGRQYLNTIHDDLIQINNDSKKNQFSSVSNVASNTKKFNSNKKTIRDILPFSNDKDTLISMNGIYFAYEKKNLILKNIDFKLNKGEFVSLIGGNGAGKSTFLQVLAGILKLVKGKVKYSKNLKIAYVHQNPIIHFSKDTVKEEFLESILNSNYYAQDVFNKDIYNTLLKLDAPNFIESDILNKLKFKNIDYSFKELINFFDISHIIDNHPYDCSGGEQQKIIMVNH